jgi:hypothetical protein
MNQAQNREDILNFTLNLRMEVGVIDEELGDEQWELIAPLLP